MSENENAVAQNDWEGKRREIQCPSCGHRFASPVIGERTLGTGDTRVAADWLPGHDHEVILRAILARSSPSTVVAVQSWIAAHLSSGNADERWTEGHGYAYQKVQRKMSTLVGAGHLSMAPPVSGTAWTYTITNKGRDYLARLAPKEVEVASQ
jgi:hypothetical protein